MTVIYKILHRDEWLAARRAGAFGGSEIDRRDGFIHFSTAQQAQETARLHFSGQQDLVVLAVDAEALGSKLRWEPSRGGALFPHFYGTLALTRVVAVYEARLNREGVPELGFLTSD